VIVCFPLERYYRLDGRDRRVKGSAIVAITWKRSLKDGNNRCSYDKYPTIHSWLFHPDHLGEFLILCSVRGHHIVIIL